MFKIILVLSLLGFSVFADLIVDLPDGQIQGHEMQTILNKTIYAFHGIPYAAPPVGNLRFQAPLPPIPWEGVRDATKERASCVFLETFSYYPDPGEQSEDCLFVNVYAPSWEQSEKLPVMVWIYGGGFIAGSGVYKYYGPDYLLEEDVIVVTLNYRLGPFGVVSTGDKAILGNAGIKDQNMALKWVQNNIEYFGGDPAKVTLFGESAGGMAVGMHLVSKKSAGLFRAAICHSGCTLSTTYNPDPKAFIYSLAKQLDDSISDQNTTIEIRDFLVKQNASDLVSAGLLLDAHGFVPAIEADDEEAFISEATYPLVEAGVNKVPLIIGTNSEESLSFLSNLQRAQTAAEGYDKDPSGLFPSVYLIPLPGSNLTEAGEVIKEAYIGSNGSFLDQLGQSLEYDSDNRFGRATLKQAQLASKYSSVFLYQFSFYGTKSKNDRYVVEGAGKVGHFDELPYLFNMSPFPLKTDADELTRQRFANLWANFAKTLNPTPEQSELLQNVVWPEVVSDNIQYLDIDDTLQVKPNRKVKESAMWDYVYDKYGTKPFIFLQPCKMLSWLLLVGKHVAMFVLLGITLLLTSTRGDLIVELPDGKIQGHEMQTSENKTFYAFHGIPYASAPVGNLRFQEPTPPKPWTDVRDATKEADSCIFLENFFYYPDPGPQSEDCLFVNVYTPSWNTSDKLPVMFWIFGGGFVAGNGNYKFYGPDYLLEEDVIVVTFNYRMGPFGFISTGDNVIPGNLGIKDQNYALQWVNKNIQYLGGDPDKITIFGESAGGMSIGMHLVSEKSSGLFRAAICHSGCTLSTTYQLDPKSFIYELAQVLDSSISEQNTTVEIRDFLLAQTPDNLINASLQVDSHGFVPTLELELENAFLSKPTFPLVEAGVNKVPLILGTTSEEAYGFLYSLDKAIETAQSFDQDPTALVPSSLVPLPGSNVTEIGEIIRDLYVGANGSFENNIVQTLEYDTDNRFGRATLKQAQLASQYTSAFLYVFSFYGTKSQDHYVVEGAGKVAHFDDLAYLFKMSPFPLVTDADQLTRKRLTKLWANFAKTLNPTPEELELLQNVIWPKVTSDNLSYLNINDTLEVRPNRKAKEFETWNDLFYKYGTQPFIVF
ncbi:uncharacterized protein LOC132700874 [Cylas formicarius]|uniref:uncharacterized protein LOC132700874 n=1 Tax=Cylas formicarius TaxID=197179 RepID=UPI0029586562|nr:uncharacterized protein LOC132700874 [Cylas formicarius]